DGKLVRGEVVYEDGPTGKTAEFSGEAEVRLEQAGDFDAREPFALGVWVNLYGLKSSEVLQKKDSSEHWAGYELGFDDVAYTGRHQRNLRVVARFAERWPDSAIEVRTKNRVPMDGAHHVLVNYDGSGKAAGLKICVDGRVWETEIAKDTLSGTFRTSASLEIGNKDTGGLFQGDRKSTRLNSSHVSISYAVFCLKKKNKKKRSLLTIKELHLYKEIKH